MRLPNTQVSERVFVCLRVKVKESRGRLNKEEDNKKRGHAENMIDYFCSWRSPLPQTSVAAKL